MSTFDYRKRLDRDELMKLAGAAAGAAAGLATVVFYLGRIWLQKVPLKPIPQTPGTSPAPAEGPGPDPALRVLAKKARQGLDDNR
jgi:hypothetical protein